MTGHDEIEEWLAPDWVYMPENDAFYWRSLQRRPHITLDIKPAHHRAWRLFSRDHYLSGESNDSARCYVAFWEGEPVCFLAILAQVGKRGMRRVSRIVTHPDYQGVGFGAAVLDTIDARYKDMGLRLRITGSHPAIVRHCERRSDLWMRTADRPNGSLEHGNLNTKTSKGRHVRTYEFIARDE